MSQYGGRGIDISLSDESHLPSLFVDGRFLASVPEHDWAASVVLVPELKGVVVKTMPHVDLKMGEGGDGFLK